MIVNRSDLIRDNMSEIKIACISDTHTKHKQLKIPECDILVCAGDFTYQGKEQESTDFLRWFNQQTQAKEKVYIAGNHEVKWDYSKHWDNQLPTWLTNKLNEFSNLHYLCNSYVELFGLKIYGSPVSPDFFPEYWAFNQPRGEKIKSTWAKIPDDIDILVTHGPMLNFLDKVPGEHVGCADLMNRVYQLKKIKLMVVGHIHDNTEIIDIPMGDRILKYVNAAV